MSTLTNNVKRATARTRRGVAHRQQALPSPVWAAEKKSSLMIVCVALVYLACSLYFTPRMMTLFDESTWWLARAAVVLFVVQIQVFWIYGSFHFVQAAFSLWTWLFPAPAPPGISRTPPVVILYTTMHDFQERAVLSCIRQDHPNCHTFILDDSKDPKCKAVVDDFAARHPGVVTVVRRADRTGYKAGNINNALRQYGKDYEYVVIADADSVFPADFVSRLLPHFGNDDSIGFVQASYHPDPHPRSRFAFDLCPQIYCMWSIYCRARNRFGSVIFLGHGGILRRDVWEAIGGFPEIISEDLAFSHRAARLGYRGRYVHDVMSYEEFPETYVQFRKQQNRYVQGICQYLHKEFLPYVRSPKVTWFEKVDTVLTCGGLLMPVFFLCFMVLYCMLLPLLFGVHNNFALQVGEAVVVVPVMLLSQRFYDLAFTWDYYLLTVLCTLAPSLGVIPLMLRHPLRGPQMLVLAAGPYMSLLVGATISALSYVVTQNAVFTATGDQRKQPNAEAGRSQLRKWFSKDLLIAALEVTLGLVLIWMCILTLNLVILAFAIAVLLAPLLSRVPWHSLALRPWLYVPYTVLITGLLIGGITLFSGAGMPMPGLSFKF